MTTARALGRPRDAAIDEAILRAAWQELNRVGYAAVTMTAVAEAAGVQKPALYRRWPSKALLVIEALAQQLPPLTSIDHGSLQADLTHVLHQLAEAWSTPAAQSLSPLLADVGTDAAAVAALHERLLHPRSAAVRGALARAQARGEVRRDAPVEVLDALLEGPLMHRAIFGSGTIDEALLDSVLAGCLAVLGAD